MKTETSGMHLTVVDSSHQAVIPSKGGIQFRNPGFRVKPGMTIKLWGRLTQYTRSGVIAHDTSFLQKTGWGNQTKCEII